MSPDMTAIQKIIRALGLETTLLRGVEALDRLIRRIKRTPGA